MSFDLFGDEATRPTVALKESVNNACKGFAEFWSIWPSGVRKVAKAQCINKWCKLGCCDVAEHIRKHVAWLKTQPDWLKDGGNFICAPLVYLNQQRWIDWEPVEVKEAPLIDPALAKILADEKRAAPMPESVRQRINELRKKA